MAGDAPAGQASIFQVARCRIPLLLGSALLGVLAYPNLNWHLLIWVALVPVFACALVRGPRQALADGWLHGLVFFTLLLRWLDHTFRTYSVMPWPLTWLPILGLAGYCGLYTGLVAAGVSWLRCRLGPAPSLAAAPVLWIAGEWVRGHALSGFPWGLLGYSQAFALPVIQIAEWTGVYGVSFLVASVNSALAGAAVLGWRRAARGLAGAAALVLLALVAGWQALAAVVDDSLRIAVVQPSIDQARKWDMAMLTRTLEVHRDLTLEATRTSARLVIWPETAIPLLLREDPALLGRLRGLAAEVGAPLVVGGIDGDRAGRRYFNSAFFLTERGIEAKYDKIHLVPFGEYVPLSGVLGFVRGWGEFISELVPGRTPVVFPFREAPFGVVICYEGLFPELFREFVAKGARLMVNITNDAWFGETSGPWQHLSVLPLRAVENRVAIARSANTGVSAVIEPSGRVRQTLGLFRRGMLGDSVPRSSRTTFYTRYGDAFAYACLGLALATVAWAVSRRAG
ncbi:MAG: apolipoprotein N-acyltransferase [Candidatus Rokubacteria bacterium]|nr:apolipoprotein N-acyltransferase [Candidatus Rokubacteria bacterium]